MLNNIRIKVAQTFVHIDFVCKFVFQEAQLKITARLMLPITVYWLKSYLNRYYEYMFESYFRCIGCSCTVLFKSVAQRKIIGRFRPVYY